jgi:hypothetical protein
MAGDDFHLSFGPLNFALSCQFHPDVIRFSHKRDLTYKALAKTAEVFKVHDTQNPHIEKHRPMQGCTNSWAPGRPILNFGRRTLIFAGL